MKADINVVGALLGIAAMLVYLSICYSCWSRPDLTKMLSLVLSCVGFVSGAALARIFFVKDVATLTQVGLGEYRVPILLGGFAVAFISGEAVFKILHAEFQRISLNKRIESSKSEALASTVEETAARSDAPREVSVR
jgi:hypothetical protein